MLSLSFTSTILSVSRRGLILLVILPDGNFRKPFFFSRVDKLEKYEGQPPHEMRYGYVIFGDKRSV